MIPRPSPPHSPVGRLLVSPEWPSPQAGRALRVRWPISGAGTVAAGAARRGSALTSPDRLAGREVGARRRERRSREQVPGARSGTRTRDHPLPPPPHPGPPPLGTSFACCLGSRVYARARRGRRAEAWGGAGERGALPLGGGGAGAAEREPGPAPRYGRRWPRPPRRPRPRGTKGTRWVPRPRRACAPIAFLVPVRTNARKSPTTSKCLSSHKALQPGDPIKYRYRIDEAREMAAKCP